MAAVPTSSLADLRRIWFGATTQQSVSDAEYTQLLALVNRDINLFSVAEQIQLMQHDPAIARWHDRLANARKVALSASLFILGDSRVLSSAGKYRTAWPELVKKKLMGARPSGMGFLAASAGGLSEVTDAAWQGGDNPWTYTGAVAGTGVYGTGFHAATIPSAGTATITYFGDIITLWYVRTVAGPTAAAITLDGVAQTALDGRNDPVQPAQSASYGTNGNYGFHTLVIDPNDGDLVIEGVEWFDNEVPFFNNGTVRLHYAEHAGFTALSWADPANLNWSAQLTNSDAFMGLGLIVLDANDISAGRTPAQFTADLKEIVSKCDGRLGTTTMPWMFINLPYNQSTVNHVNAAYEARGDIGVNRFTVFDMAALVPGRTWPSGLSADGVHPNDAGHLWIADNLCKVLDPYVGLGPIPTFGNGTRRLEIDASTPTESRTSWAYAYTGIPQGGFDQSGGGTTQGERHHRVWADVGTYRGTITMQEDAALGNVEALMGRWVGNTPTLTSMGSKTNVAATPTMVTTQLGTTIVNDVAGWVPIYIRKTTATGAVRFSKLVLDKIA